MPIDSFEYDYNIRGWMTGIIMPAGDYFNSFLNPEDTRKQLKEFILI
jgi:hypothetical protein